MPPPLSTVRTSLAQPLPLQPHPVKRRLIEGMTAAFSIFIYLLLVVGSAAAMSWVLFAVIFAVTWLHFRTLERRSA